MSNIVNVSVASTSNKVKRSSLKVFDLFRIRQKGDQKWGKQVYMAAGVSTVPPSDRTERTKYKSIRLPDGMDTISYNGDAIVEVIGRAELNVVLHRDYADLASHFAS